VIPRATLLFLPAVLLLACQSPSQGQTTPSPEQIQPSAGTVDPAQPTNAQPASPAAAEPTRPNFVAWRDAFKTEALAAGVSAATFDRAFDGVLPNFDILAKDDVQPEYTKPIWAYLDTAVSPEHVATGRQRLADNKAALRKATKPYGVPPQIVIAIWGLESAYGVNTGGYNVIEALATMAYGSRRPDVFRQNLIDALLILEHGDITPEDMQGSWAGAMGQTQFMPAAFRQYAVDGDGDGKRDIWRSLPDVFASTASFLAAHGWKPGEPWGAEVRLPAKFDWEQAEMDVTKTVTEWRKLGVKRADGKAMPKLNAPASIIAPAGHRGPAFIVFENFRTILDYNNSLSYALAVAHLADVITGKPEFVAQWPREEPPLSRTDKQDLQNLLAAHGFDPGDNDGVIGPKTRVAIRQFQRQIGEVPDGFPTVALLTRLRALSSS
jgi:membrane-bound lytic murein transglycosylase B